MRQFTPEQMAIINKRRLIADIVLIFLISLLGIYIIINIEHFKAIGSDVCRLCMEKTKAICINPNLS